MRFGTFRYTWSQVIAFGGWSCAPAARGIRLLAARKTRARRNRSATLAAIARTLAAATDAGGRKLDVVRIPGPGLYRNALGEIAPASHMNFVIANGVVVVPVYGTPTQTAAIDALQAVFPGRKVVGVPSRGLLGCGEAGGGSFHCITQQEPL